MMSMHMSFQVLAPTNSRMGPDGLYRYRWLIYTVWLVLPAFDASLAFVQKGGHAYLYQGTVCSLPIRPFWFRLALSWIPRYLIVIYVLYVALRIYLHVGSGFKVFARHVEGSTTAGRTGHGETANITTGAARTSKLLSVVQTVPTGSFGMQSIVDPTPDTLLAVSETPIRERRPSAVRWDSGTPKDNSLKESDKEGEAGSSASDSSSWRNSQGAALSAGVQASGAPGKSQNIAASPSKKPVVTTTETSGDSMALPTIDESNNPMAASANPRPIHVNTADITIAKRRRAIMRQTRLLFIYPCVYAILMVIPFVSHALSYSNYYAQHPIFPITAIANFCFAIMGAADCIIFCWREKPWTLIPGTDGSVAGSLCFWRFLFPSYFSGHRTSGDWSAGHQHTIALGDMSNVSSTDSTHEPRRLSSHAAPAPRGKLAIPKSVRPTIHKRNFSGQSDRAAMDAEHAAERLAMERAAYAEQRRVSTKVGGPGGAGDELGGGGNKTRDWFDRPESWLMKDGHEEEEEGDEEVKKEEVDEKGGV